MNTENPIIKKEIDKIASFINEFIDEEMSIIIRCQLLLEQKINEIIEMFLQNPSRFKIKEFSEKINFLESISFSTENKDLWGILRQLGNLRNEVAHNLPRNERKEKLRNLFQSAKKLKNNNLFSQNLSDIEKIFLLTSRLLGALSAMMEGDIKPYRNFINRRLEIIDKK